MELKDITARLTLITAILRERGVHCVYRLSDLAASFLGGALLENDREAK